MPETSGIDWSQYADAAPAGKVDWSQYTDGQSPPVTGPPTLNARRGSGAQGMSAQQSELQSQLQDADYSLKNNRPVIKSPDHSILDSLTKQIKDSDLNIESRRSTLDHTDPSAISRFNADIAARNLLAQQYESQRTKFNQTIGSNSRKAASFNRNLDSRNQLASKLNSENAWEFSRRNLPLPPTPEPEDTFGERLRNAGNPGSFEGHPENLAGYVESGPLEVAKGLGNLITAPPGPKGRPQAYKGITRIASGAGTSMLPVAPFSAAAAPLATAGDIALGYVGSHGAGAIAKKAGASPEQEEMWRTLGWAVPITRGIIARSLGLEGAQVGVQSGEEGTAVGIGGQGGTRAGVAVTPGEIRIGGQFKGGKARGISIPRGGQPSPAQPGLEPPTIEGQAMQPTPSEQALLDHSTIQARAANVVQGKPVVTPPPPPPGPEPPTDVANGHISPETVQGIGQALAKLPPNLRAQGIIEAHGTLSRVLQQQGKMVGPDGAIHIIDSPKAADKLAGDWINAEVERQDGLSKATKSADEKPAAVTSTPTKAAAGEPNVRVTRKSQAAKLSQTPLRVVGVESAGETQSSIKPADNAARIAESSEPNVSGNSGGNEAGDTGLPAANNSSANAETPLSVIGEEEAEVDNAISNVQSESGGGSEKLAGNISEVKPSATAENQGIVGHSASTKLAPFAKGDTVLLPKGESGTIKTFYGGQVNPSARVEVKSSDGSTRRASVQVSKLRRPEASGESNLAPAAEKSETPSVTRGAFHGEGVSTDLKAPESKPYKEPAPENLGFDHSVKTGPDIGQQVRKDMPALPRGERRKIPRTPQEVETQELWKQARTELGDTKEHLENLTTEQVEKRVEELRAKKVESAGETTSIPQRVSAEISPTPTGQLGHGEISSEHSATTVTSGRDDRVLGRDSAVVEGGHGKTSGTVQTNPAAELRTKIDSLTTDYDNALEAGDMKKAGALRKEMRTAEADLVKAIKSPSLASELLSGESGSFEPGKIREFLDEQLKDLRGAREIERGIFDLEARHSGRVLKAAQMIKAANQKYGDKAVPDYAQIYHHLEDPEGVSLTPQQDEILDNTVLPVMETNDELAAELKDGLVPIENYVHRVVKGKGGWFDRIIAGAKGTGKGNILSKSAPQTKGRTMMALEGEEQDGNGANHTKRLVVSIKGGQVTAWIDGEPENLGGISHTDEGKTWYDKDDHPWKLTQATTREIEKNTELEYYHNALASALVSNLQLAKAVDALHFINDLKASPEFKDIAFEEGKGNPPAGWKPTTLPQLRGYSFEPHYADVFDRYAERLRTSPGALDQIGAFMRVTMLLNPLMHPMNVAASWAMDKGVTGFLPHNWMRIGRTGMQAIKDVATQNQNFLDDLDAGAALQSHREATRDITKLLFDQLGEGLESEKPWALRMAKSLGMAPVTLLNALHKFSSKIAWTASDILYLQSAYENQSRGMSLKDSLRETGRTIPEYRLPTHILNSKAIGQLMGNNWATIFGSYHHALLKSFAEAGKSALGLNEAPAQGNKARDVAKGWDRLALLGLVAFALYPLLDEAAKKITGDEKGRVKRFGPFAVIDAWDQVRRKTKSPGDALQTSVTPAPQTKAAVEMMANREFYNGRQIYNPHDDWETQAHQIGGYLFDQLGMIGQGHKASQSETAKKKFLYGQVGIQFRGSDAERIAQDISNHKMGSEAAEPGEMEDYGNRRDILDALRSGNSKPLQDAEAKHELTHRQILNLKDRAKLTPLQDKVNDFTYPEFRRVYDAATAKEKQELEHIYRRKLNSRMKDLRSRGEQAVNQ